MATNTKSDRMLKSNILYWRRLTAEKIRRRSESAYTRQVNLQHNNDEWMILLLADAMTSSLHGMLR